MAALFGSFFISPRPIHAEEIPKPQVSSKSLLSQKPKMQALQMSCIYENGYSGSKSSVSFGTPNLSFTLNDLEKGDTTKPIISRVSLSLVLVYTPPRYNETLRIEFSQVPLNLGKVAPVLERNACPAIKFSPPPKTKAEIVAATKRWDADSRLAQKALANLMEKHPGKSYPIPDRTGELAAALPKVISEAIAVFANLNRGRYLGIVPAQNFDVVSSDNDFFFIRINDSDQLFTLSRKIEWSSVQNPEYVVQDFTYAIKELFVSGSMIEAQVEPDCTKKGLVQYGPSPPFDGKEMYPPTCIDE
ncbi:hypothetical protein HY988_07110 [Candidatus Micrarchaeota archaeon]|nr:hypothetical protein [Candidatus Micrarchaeota archaeon]